MSVYIPGMEMPSGCKGCYFLLDIGICCALMAADCPKKAVGDYRFEENKRHPYCPLVPVPDHGRLIDADALSEIIIEQETNEYNITHFPKSWARAMCAFEDIVLDSPTIIPGDKEGEG